MTSPHPQSPTPDEIEAWLSDPELVEWIASKWGFYTHKIPLMLKELTRQIKADRNYDHTVFNKFDLKPIGVNLANWTLWTEEQLTLPGLPSTCQPDWKKSVWDFVED